MRWEATWSERRTLRVNGEGVKKKYEETDSNDQSDSSRHISQHTPALADATGWWW